MISGKMSKVSVTVCVCVRGGSFRAFASLMYLIKSNVWSVRSLDGAYDADLSCACVAHFVIERVFCRDDESEGDSPLCVKFDHT